MLNIKVFNSNNIAPGLFESVSQLLHESFAERRSQGINFKCGTFSAADVEHEFSGKGGYLLVAEEDGSLVGTVSLINRRKGKYRYASHDNLAVLSSCKGKGVASALFAEVLRIVNKDNLDFITSYTATNAVSSVLFHKKMGFLIWGKNYGNEYNSYSFIYPLNSFKLLRNKPIRITIYWVKTSIGYIKKKIKI